MEVNSKSATNVDALVGSNLRQFRIAHKMSQSQLASQLGITFQQVQKYERGSNRIGASRLWDICNIFSISPNDLFLGADKHTGIESNDEAQRIDFFQHPYGAKLASAFLQISDRDVEQRIIELCKTLSEKKIKHN